MRSGSGRKEQCSDLQSRELREEEAGQITACVVLHDALEQVAQRRDPQVSRKAKRPGTEQPPPSMFVRLARSAAPLLESKGPPRDPSAPQSKSEGQRDLAELQLVRDALVEDRVASTNRGKHLRTPVAKQLNKQRLKQIERQIKRIDAEIRKRLQAEEALERQSEILTSIPGISDVTAAGLIVHMPELGTLTGSRAASLAGLAPVTRESGSWKGRSFIQGGRHHVRRLLYMPALVAIRCNPDLPRAQVRSPRRQGQTAEGRPYGGDAEAPDPRQHPRPAGPHLDGVRARTPRMSAIHPTGKQRQTAPAMSSRLTQRPRPAFTATVCPPCLPGPAPSGTLLTWILTLRWTRPVVSPSRGTVYCPGGGSIPYGDHGLRGENTGSNPVRWLASEKPPIVPPRRVAS